jgi:hypothetical protein
MSPQPITSATASSQLALYQQTLATALASPDTDPQAAPLEAAHSSGLHEYIGRLEDSIADKRNQIDVLTEMATQDAPTVEGDPRRNLTAFEAAAPVLRQNAKAQMRQSIGVLMTEIGLLGLAAWATWVLTERHSPLDIERPAGYFPRFALFLAIGLMIISGMSGIVYQS